MKDELMLEMFVIPEHRDALIEYVKREKEYHKGFDPSKSIFDYPVIIWNDKRDKCAQYYFIQPDQWLGKVTDIAFDYDPVCQHDVCRIRFYNQTERNKQFFEWIKDHMSHVYVYPSFLAEPIYAPPIGFHADKFPNKLVDRIRVQRILGFILMVTDKKGTVEMMRG